MKYLSLAFLLTIAMSCTQDEVLDELIEPVALANMHDCHENENWDPATFRNTLEGTWKWMYSACGDDTEFERFQGVTITFEGVNTLQFHKNGKLVEETEWNLSSDDLKFRVVSEIQSVLLSGNIYFCNDYQMTTDGELCKHMFYRELN